MQAGFNLTELSPRKTELPSMVQNNHREKLKVKRKLTYLQKSTKALTNRAKQAPLSGMDISNGARCLLAGELRNYSRGLNGRIWTTREKCFALTIYKRSAKTYRYLRKCLTLPGETTVKNILREIKLKPGVCPLLLRFLEKKTFNALPKGKAAALMFDEMGADEFLEYRPELDLVMGYEDFGPGGRTHLIADKVMVFKVRLLESDFTIPIAFYPVHGTCPKEKLALLIEEVVRSLATIDFSTIVSISDQGPTNRGAITILRSKLGEYDPVYEVDGKKIVHLFDFPHLLKSLRNNLLTSDLQFEMNKFARWQDIIDFFSA